MIINDITNFSLALQGTFLRSVDLSNQRLNDTSAKDFTTNLYGTRLRSVNLSNNLISAVGARDIVTNLQGTLVEELDLSENLIGDEGAKVLVHCLHGTSVRSLNLSRCRISREGAEYLLANLPSQLVSLGLEGNLGISFIWKNNIPKLVAESNLINNLEEKSGCRAYLQQKLLSKLYCDGDYAEAIKLNQQKLLIAPLEWARLRHLSEDKKKQYLSQNLHFPSNEKDETRYAGGILMRSDLPEDVFAKILSFLPLMEGRNGQPQTATYLRLAAKKNMANNVGKELGNDDRKPPLPR